MSELSSIPISMLSGTTVLKDDDYLIISRNTGQTTIESGEPVYQSFKTHLSTYTVVIIDKRYATTDEVSAISTYLEDQIQSVRDDVVLIDGAQTITGEKTFASKLTLADSAPLDMGRAQIKSTADTRQAETVFKTWMGAETASMTHRCSGSDSEIVLEADKIRLSGDTFVAGDLYINADKVATEKYVNDRLPSGFKLKTETWRFSTRAEDGSEKIIEKKVVVAVEEG